MPIHDKLAGFNVYICAFIDSDYDFLMSFRMIDTGAEILSRNRYCFVIKHSMHFTSRFIAPTSKTGSRSDYDFVKSAIFLLSFVLC